MPMLVRLVMGLLVCAPAQATPAQDPPAQDTVDFKKAIQGLIRASNIESSEALEEAIQGLAGAVEASLSQDDETDDLGAYQAAIEGLGYSAADIRSGDVKLQTVHRMADYAKVAADSDSTMKDAKRLVDQSWKTLKRLGLKTGLHSAEVVDVCKKTPSMQDTYTYYSNARLFHRGVYRSYPSRTYKPKAGRTSSYDWCRADHTYFKPNNETAGRCFYMSEWRSSLEYYKTDPIADFQRLYSSRFSYYLPSNGTTGKTRWDNNRRTFPKRSWTYEAVAANPWVPKIGDTVELFASVGNKKVFFGKKNVFDDWEKIRIATSRARSWKARAQYRKFVKDEERAYCCLGADAMNRDSPSNKYGDVANRAYVHKMYGTFCYAVLAGLVKEKNPERKLERDSETVGEGDSEPNFKPDAEAEDPSEFDPEAEAEEEPQREEADWSATQSLSRVLIGALLIAGFAIAAVTGALRQRATTSAGTMERLTAALEE